MHSIARSPHRLTLRWSGHLPWCERPGIQGPERRPGGTCAENLVGGVARLDFCARYWAGDVGRNVGGPPRMNP